MLLLRFVILIAIAIASVTSILAQQNDYDWYVAAELEQGRHWHNVEVLRDGRIMVIGGILPTASWSALGGMMSDLFDEKARYTALAFSYNVGASVAATLPFFLTLMRVATDNAWWHPGVVLAGLSALTLFSALIATRMSVRVTDPQYQRS